MLQIVKLTLWRLKCLYHLDPFLCYLQESWGSAQLQCHQADQLSYLSSLAAFEPTPQTVSVLGIGNQVKGSVIAPMNARSNSRKDSSAQP